MSNSSSSKNEEREISPEEQLAIEIAASFGSKIIIIWKMKVRTIIITTTTTTTTTTSRLMKVKEMVMI